MKGTLIFNFISMLLAGTPEAGSTWYGGLYLNGSTGVKDATGADASQGEPVALWHSNVNGLVAMSSVASAA